VVWGLGRATSLATRLGCSASQPPTNPLSVGIGCALIEV
jgi:hypothetical protein